MSKTNKSYLVLLPLLFALSACYHPGKIVYQDSNVTLLHSDAFFSSINVHGMDRMSLQVDGKVYTNVRGAKPYYLVVPELSAIVFVTEESEAKATLHIITKPSQKHLAIPIGGCAFGHFIGRESPGKKAGEPEKNYIEFIGNDTIRLVTRSSFARSASKVNLKTLRTEHEESVHYDESGAVRARFLDGRRIQ